MRKRSLDTLLEMARGNSDIVFIGSDLGVDTLNQFRDEMPERFFMEGISEAHVIGMAAGLALSGKLPYVHTIATFLTRRCFDQIAVDICLSNLNVRLLAGGGGTVYSPLGPTHMATEDIALMRALPNMTVFVPADADEMARGMEFSQKHRGPLYFRFARGGEKIVSRPQDEFQIGKGIVLREPGEVLFISCGVMVSRCLEVADLLAQKGITAGVVNMHSIKPLDEDLLRPLLLKTRYVFTAEEHSIIGGLGSAIAELLAEMRPCPSVVFRRFGLRDEFPSIYGRQEDQLEFFGLSAPKLFAHVLTLIEK